MVISTPSPPSMPTTCCTAPVRLKSTHPVAPTWRHLPWLVAEQGGEVLGFAYANWFKPRPAYRFSAEDSVYVAEAARGSGIGRALLSALMEQAEAAGVRQLMAVVGDSANTGSIRLHQSLGFAHIGLMRSVGWKHGAWRDIVLMQRPLGSGDTQSPE